MSARANGNVMDKRRYPQRGSSLKSEFEWPGETIERRIVTQTCLRIPSDWPGASKEWLDTPRQHAPDCYSRAHIESTDNKKDATFHNACFGIQKDLVSPVDWGCPDRIGFRTIPKSSRWGIVWVIWKKSRRFLSKKSSPYGSRQLAERGRQRVSLPFHEKRS